MPDEVVALANAMRSRAEALAHQAQEVVRIVGSRSELQELFDEGGRYEAWHAELDGLIRRLARRA